MTQINDNNFGMRVLNNNDSNSEAPKHTNIYDRFQRRVSRKVYVGDVPIGGGSPISVQSMTKVKTSDVKGVLDQIRRCEEAGVDIIRVTVNNKAASEAIGEIVKQSNIPIVADIHFNYTFALKSIEAGVAKVRINPGNIGKIERIQKVLKAAKERGIPIRIGVNSGSLENDILEKYGYPTDEALFESAMRHAEIAADNNFDDIVISVKSTSVPLMISAYRLIAERTDFPLHLGVTEAGRYEVGTIKSSVGIGTLLAEGIGDTIRVSLTDDSWKEVEVGKHILKSLGLAQRDVEIISCPTCGRIDVDLFKLTEELEERTKYIKKPVTVSVLGCAVNGPGEAREADIGVAAGKGQGILFKKGVQVRVVKEHEIVDELVKEIEAFEPENS